MQHHIVKDRILLYVYKHKISRTFSYILFKLFTVTHLLMCDYKTNTNLYRRGLSLMIAQSVSSQFAFYNLTNNLC